MEFRIEPLVLVLVVDPTAAFLLDSVSDFDGGGGFEPKPESVAWSLVLTTSNGQVIIAPAVPPILQIE